MPKMDSLQTEQDNMGVRLTQLSQDHDQYSNDMGTPAARLHDAQEDLKGMLRTLARQVENFQGRTHPGSSQTETSASVVMDVEDLKSKGTRLIEQVDQRNRHLNTFAPLLAKAQFPEAQMEEWQRRVLQGHSVKKWKIVSVALSYKLILSSLSDMTTVECGNSDCNRRSRG